MRRSTLKVVVPAAVAVAAIVVLGIGVDSWMNVVLGMTVVLGSFMALMNLVHN